MGIEGGRAAARRVQLGQWGEGVAAHFLEQSGYTVIDRNWRCRHGELDLVCADPTVTTVVFVEVKTRSSMRCGGPVDGVDPQKLRRLHLLGALWLREHPADTAGIRFDVVGVLAVPGADPEVTHLVGVY